MRYHALIPVLLVPLLVVLAAPVVAQQRIPDARAINMDFDGVDIHVFIKFISELTGRNFVVDEKVRGKVTVLSPGSISVDEAYEVFESVLQVYGFLAVPAGEVTKILPLRESPVSGLPTVVSRRPGAEGDGYVTQVIQLDFVQVEDVLRILTPMVSKAGLITAYPPSDLLIITDAGGNIQRLLRIIEAIDVKDTEAQVAVLPLQHASAEKIAAKLSRIMEITIQQDKGSSRQPRINIEHDERMNALIVFGGPRDIERVRELVAELDVAAPREQGNIRVHRLEHADATELAAVLNGLVGQRPSPDGGGGEEGRQIEVEAVISEDVGIIPDKATNSLVITSGPEDYAELARIIEALDRPRKQVLVEALIMEISSDQTVQLGTQFQGGFSTTIGPDGGLIGGFTNPLGTGTNLLTPGGTPGFGVGAASVPVTINGVTFTNLDALITFGKNNSEFNIISTPQVMTLDNEEATIIVAENRPFQTAENVGRNVDDFTVNQFTYRDVGTTLRITPQINEGRRVKLKIFQEVSEIDPAATAATSALLPVTRKRTTETTVLVQESQTVVLSGLIGKTSSRSVSKVPGLGDIPVLGWLFKVKNESERKTNLLIFIRPKIVSDPEQAEEIYLDKFKQLERYQFQSDEPIPPMLMGPMAIGLNRKTW